MKFKLLFLTVLIVNTLLAQTPIENSGGQYDVLLKKDASNSVHSLVYLPEDYNDGSNKLHPLWVFYHGIGEGGTTSGTLANIFNSTTAGGPAHEIKKGRKMSFINPTTGVRETYIVICPQSSGDGFTAVNTGFILADILSKYRVDPNRIILSCISQGGYGTLEYAGSAGGYDPQILPAAVVPMSATIYGPFIAPIGQNLYNDNIGFWGFGDVTNDTHGANTDGVRYYYNVLDPLDRAKFTNMPGAGHGGWNVPFDTAYRENGQSIYEWGLTQTRGATPPPPVIPKPLKAGRIIMARAAWGGAYYKAAGGTFKVIPGDTLVLRTQDGWTNQTLELENFYGTASNPIVIINDGVGQLSMGAISFKNCRYIKLTGSGNNEKYGFLFTSTTGKGTAVNIQGRSKNIRVERTEVRNMTYMVWCKTEALQTNCQDSLMYPNWYMDSIFYNDNYGKNIGQDAVYFGSTSPNGQRGVTCDGKIWYPIPMRLSNIKIYNNRIDSCNRTAIQLSGADRGLNEIYNNHITRAGFELNDTQGAGIISGGVTRVNIYNNRIVGTYNSGITVWGAGLNTVENNYIDSSGYIGNVFNARMQPSAILANTYVTAPTQLNTILIIKNNKVGKVATLDGKQIVVLSTQNTYSADNVVCGNATLSGSAASVFVENDIIYSKAGCIVPNILPVANAGKDVTIKLPTKSVKLNGTGTDADGTIVSYKWAKVSGGTFRITNYSVKNPTISKLTQGIYVFRLTVTDNLGGVGTANITIKVLP